MTNTEEWENSFDDKFPEIGHRHDQNCEFECHLRKDIKFFISSLLKTEVDKALREGVRVAEKMRELAIKEIINEIDKYGDPLAGKYGTLTDKLKKKYGL